MKDAFSLRFKSFWRKTLLFDVCALLAVLVIIYLFYYPTTDPIESRYAYHTNVFERSAFLVNADYDNLFAAVYPGRPVSSGSLEKHMPFLTFAARGALWAFPGNPSMALLLLHLGIIVIATISTFLLNRLYLSTIGSLFVTLFLFCGRILLPITLGLGLTQIHLMIPLSLGFVFALTKILSGSVYGWRKVAWILLAASCLAWIYFLGSHEVYFGLSCLVGGILILAGGWLRSVFVKRRTFPWRKVRDFASVVAIASLVGIAVMAALRYGTPASMNPAPFGTMLTHSYMFDRLRFKTNNTTDQSLADKMRVLRGTFVDGRYLSSFGKRHENTFLFPGPGFNGVIPLFVIPGFLLGLRVYYRRLRIVLSVKEERRAQGDEYFICFLGLLLVLFVVAVAMGKNTKPTYYTYSIYAILVVSVWGFEGMFGWLRRKLEGRSVESGDANQGKKVVSIIVISTFAAILVFFCIKRLTKNYNDLRTYEKEYAHQIPTIGLKNAMKEAGSKAKVIAIHGPSGPQRNYVNHPAVGLMLGYRVPPDLRLVWTDEALSKLPAGTKIIRLNALPSMDLYYVPRSWWPSRVPRPDTPVQKETNFRPEDRN
jgi:hypothetical protein